MRLPFGSRFFSLADVRNGPSKIVLCVRAMPQLTIRFPEKRVREIRATAKQRAFSSPTALIRHAVERELIGDDNAEQRIATALDQIHVDLERLCKDLQTLFAFVDALAKAVLTALPAQTSTSVNKARERYESFLKSAAASLTDGVPPALRNGFNS